MSGKILLVTTALLALVFSAQAFEQNSPASSRMQINDVIQVIFQQDDVLVLTPDGKVHLKDWADSLVKSRRHNKEICPTCTSSIGSINFVPSKNSRTTVTAKGEMWGEIEITISLASFDGIW